MSIDELDLQDVYNFIANGSLDNAPPGIAEYLSIIDKIRGMMLRIDKWANDESIIKDLILVDKISRYKAKKLIDETREYFYKDTNVSKAAWRNIYAEKLEKVLHFGMLSMTTIGDAEKVSNIILRLASLRQLDKVDIEELPDELFQKQFVMYSIDADALGLPKVDRNRLKELIDKKIPDLTEKEKQQLYREADITPFITFPNEQENPRKV